jgi:cytochrome c2
MIMCLKHSIFTLAIMVSISAFAHSQQPVAQANIKQPVPTARKAPSQNEGARIFQQNCSRCHNAPQGFSKRISGTVVRHMRVRASLSQSDVEQLLRFFNP